MLNLVILLKGKRGQLGEIRTWGGKKYQKTPDGWKPTSKIHPEGYTKKKSKMGSDKGFGRAVTRGYSKSSKKKK